MWLWAASLFVAGAAPAQGGVVRPLSSQEALRRLITVERKDGLVVQVRWGKHEIPMVRPAATLAFGLSRDGDQLVLLANGVRDSLDLYVFGKKTGDLYSFQTQGGRRLRRDFNGGQGSWPWVEGSHLILFGYEKEGKLEFRAVSRSGQVHADRQLDLALTGWQIDSDPDRGYVRVRFAGVQEPLEFHHPLSARLELEKGLLEFGTVQLGSSTKRLLGLRNSGKRPMTLRLGLQSAQFELGATEPRERRLAPGGHSRIEVIFKPKTAGVHEARMKLAATGSIRDLLVVLRGEARAVSRVVTADTSKATTSTQEAAETGPKEERLDAPVLLEHRLHPLGGGEVLVLGRIATAGRTRPLPQLSLRNAQTPGEVSSQPDADGRFHARLQAGQFARIEIATADGQRRSPWAELGEVQPQLEIAGTDLIVRCLPNQRFLLLAVPPGSPTRILGSWRGRARSAGLVRYPLSSFGVKEGGTAPMALVLVTEADGETRTSATLRVQ